MSNNHGNSVGVNKQLWQEQRQRALIGAALLIYAPEVFDTYTVADAAYFMGTTASSVEKGVDILLDDPEFVDPVLDGRMSLTTAATLAKAKPVVSTNEA